MSDLALELKKALEAVKPKVIQWHRIPKEPIPNRPPAGRAVVCDEMGRGKQLIEVRHVMWGEKCEISPLDGFERGKVDCGAHVGNVRLTKELVVLAYTPYPETREDGEKCVNGTALYPVEYLPKGTFRENDGTFYNAMNVDAQKMMEAAMIEASAKDEKKRGA